MITGTFAMLLWPAGSWDLWTLYLLNDILVLDKEKVGLKILEVNNHVTNHMTLSMFLYHTIVCHVTFRSNLVG